MNYEAALGFSVGANLALLTMLIICYISRESLKSDLNFSRQAYKEMKKSYDLGVEKYISIHEQLTFLSNRIKTIKKELE